MKQNIILIFFLGAEVNLLLLIEDITIDILSFNCKNGYLRWCMSVQMAENY